MFFYQRQTPSSRLQEPHGVVALEKGEAAPGGKAVPGFEMGIAEKQVSGEVGSAVYERRSLRPLRDAEARVAALARPQISLPPRRRRSSSAITNPSSTCRRISRRDLAVSDSGAL